MKKTIGTLALFLSLFSIGYGQFTKGKFMAGGSFSATSNSYKYNDGSATSKSNSVSVNPQVGFFIADNFAAGAGATLSSSNYKAPSGSLTNELSSTGINFSPFARYYVGKLFSQATFEVGYSKIKADNSNLSNVSFKNSGWSFAAGYAYLLNEHVAIEPQVGYGTNYVKNDSGNKTTTGNLFLKIGIQVYIGK